MQPELDLESRPPTVPEPAVPEPAVPRPAAPEPATPPDAADEVYVLPVSFAQQRLWFLSQLYPRSSAYNLFAAWRVSGRLDPRALALALAEVARRHETLRTSFYLMDGEPVQVVAPSPSVTLATVDLRRLSRARRERALTAGLAQVALAPFDLAHGPLLRVALFRLTARQSSLLYSIHHIIADGWSEAILTRELLACYRAARRGADADLPELPLQYGDFAHWQREWLQGEVREELGAFWRRQLAGASQTLALPTDFPRPAVSSQRGAYALFTIDAGDTAALQGLARREGTTLFAVLLTAFGVLLARHAGQDDVLVGTPSASRDRVELESLIGLFLNTLVLRLDLRGDPTCRELVGRVREMLYETQEHRDLPFETLVAELGVERDPSRSPLFQAFFNLDAATPETLDSGDLTLVPLPIPTATAKFDLLWNVQQGASSLGAALEYCTDLFAAPTIARLIGHLRQLLAAIPRHLGCRVSELPLLTAAERHQLLHAWNDTRRDEPAAGASVHQMFAQRAARAAEAIALTAPAGSFSYRLLDAWAGRIAARLRRAGVGPEVPVGLFLSAGPPALAAILGTLEAGGAYVPLDPGYPAERLALLLQDAGISVVVTSPELAGAVASAAPDQVLRLVDAGWSDQPPGGGDGPPASRPAASPDAGWWAGPDQLAYVLYTSGSTGRPKGVMVPHGGAANYLAWATAAYDVAAGSGAPVHSPLTFDLTLTSLLTPLLAGRTVAFLPPARGVTALAESLAGGAGFSLVKLTPAHLALLNRSLPAAAMAGATRALVLGGEALPAQELSPWREQAPATRLINEYGPTETVVGCAVHEVASESPAAGAVPIGRPIANNRVYLLDAHLEPVPIGVVGEVCIGGAQLARGYLGRPDLTAASFIPDAWSGEAGARVYRSGDLARHGGGGTIDLLGRADAQVKVHGFRIEPGEIEAALVADALVREAAVVARDEPEGKRLVAYVVAAGEPPTSEQLRRALLRRLPEHMVPAVFVVLDRLPLTANGKVDRRALPAPGVAPRALATAYVAPRNPIEETLAAVWTRVLAVDRVGVEDNFFVLGGDSIRGIQVVALARERGLEVSLQQVVQLATVAELAAAAAVAGRPREAAGESALAPLPTAPFSLLAPADRARLPEDVEDAYPLARMQEGMLYHVEERPDAPVFHSINSYHLRLPLDPELFTAAVLRIAARHANLRTSFDLASYSEPLQLVHREARFPVGIEDLRHLPPAEQRRRIAEHWESELLRPFDLSRPPQLRFQIHRTGDDTLQFTLTENHACIDGWSLHSAYGELLTCYLSLLRGEEAPALPELHSTFRDFVALERRVLASPEQRNFWDQQLAGCSPLALPRWPGVRHDPGKRRVFRYDLPLPAALTGRLRELAREEAVPLSSLLLAVHLVVMSSLGGRRDTLTSMSTNGRLETPDGHLVGGLFLNTVPVRLDLGGGTWRELAARVHQLEIEITPYRRYPVAAIQEGWGREQLLATSFLYLHFHVLEDVVRSQGLTSVGSGLFVEETNFPLITTFQTSYTSPALIFNLDCDRAVLADAQIVAIKDYYLAALDRAAADFDGRYDTFTPLSAAERQALLVEWNDAAAAAAAGRLFRPVHDLVAAQAASHPERPAVASDEGGLTYAELAAQAGQVARELRRRGIGPEARVAVCAERSPAAIVGLLGALAAGAAYVPLDPADPPDRLQRLVADCAAAAVLAEPRWQAKLASCGVPLIELPAAGGDGAVHAAAVAAEEAAEAARDAQAAGDAQVAEDAQAAGSAAPAGGVHPDQLAYVMYTSGSTGEPKGVMVGHRQLRNYLDATLALLRPPAGASYALVSTLAADLSITAVFTALTTGGELHLLREEQVRDAARMAEYLSRHPVDFLKIVPSHLAALLDDTPPANVLPRRWLLLGGEALGWELCERVRALAPALRVWNEYGPTEATVAVAAHEVADESADRGSPTVPIGRPLANARLYVLDSHLRPVAPGVAGELYLGGSGLARGYLGRPALTAESFIPDPWSGEPGARVYRSRDLGRHLPDGRIEYLGRTDFQLKIRGFRVEPQEIAAALLRYPAVKEAVVVGGRDGHETSLTAYVVADREIGATASELQRFVSYILPGPMVPSAVVLLPAMPLTRSGKLDRRALPPPAGAEAAHRPAEPLRTPTEVQLVHLWSELLGTTAIGRHDDFFELGGNSLLAIRLVSRIRKRWQVKVLLGTLIAARTVAKQARLLDAEADAQPAGHVVAIQPLGARPPIYMVHPGHGTVVCYLNLAGHLGPEQPFYGLQALDVEKDLDPFISIEEMAARYVAALREARPAGPYLVGGWSFGGLVAFEMAQQLTRMGEQVPRLLMLDCSVPAISEEMSQIDTGLMRAFLLVTHAREAAELARKDPPPYTAHDIAGLAPDEQMGLLLDDLQRRDAMPLEIDRQTLQRYFDVRVARIYAMCRYVPRPYRGKVTMFRTSQPNLEIGLAEVRDIYERATRGDLTYGWSAIVAEPIDIRHIPGHHESMINEPHVRDLARELRGCLDEVEQELAGAAAPAPVTKPS
jgi:amino acid adenylation domain-containing protein